jgi:hypothetical protein
MRKHPYSHTVIEHHKDGSATVHHIHEKHNHVHDLPVRDGDVRGATGSHDELMDHMMDHTSMPNVGEDQDESGQPMEAAKAAPVMPPPAPTK